MEVVVTTGQLEPPGGGGDYWSYKSCKSSPPTPSFLLAGCPSCRPTNSVTALKGKISHSIDLITPNSPRLPTLSLTTNSSWLPWGRVAMPLISALMPVPQFSHSLTKENDQLLFLLFIIKRQHTEQEKKRNQTQQITLVNPGTAPNQAHNYPLIQPSVCTSRPKGNEVMSAPQHVIQLGTRAPPSEWKWTWQHTEYVSPSDILVLKLISVLVFILFSFFYSRWNFTTQRRSRARQGDTNRRNGSRS